MPQRGDQQAEHADDDAHVDFVHRYALAPRAGLTRRRQIRPVAAVDGDYGLAADERRLFGRRFFFSGLLMLQIPRKLQAYAVSAVLTFDKLFNNHVGAESAGLRRRKATRFGTRRKCRFFTGRRCTLPICYLLGISLDVLLGFYVFVGCLFEKGVDEWE